LPVFIIYTKIYIFCRTFLDPGSTQISQAW